MAKIMLQSDKKCDTIDHIDTKDNSINFFKRKRNMKDVQNFCKTSNGEGPDSFEYR